jgi:hypothetical protein
VIRKIRGPGVGRFLMYVLWPAFLMSAVAVGILFSMFDPAEIDVMAHNVTETRQIAYTAGFFAFWALFSAGGAMTYVLAMVGSAPPGHVQHGAGHV